MLNILCLPARPSTCLQINIYADEDGARKEEIAQLRLGTADNVFRWGWGWGRRLRSTGVAIEHAASPMLALHLRCRLLRRLVTPYTLGCARCAR